MSVKTSTFTALALFHLALCMDIPAPEHLVLSSQYFIHTLSWEKGPGSPDGVLYTVRIQTLRGEVALKECVNVTSPLRCNLTEALSDAEETYHISVFAALGHHISQRTYCKPFRPILNTTLEPPLLTVTPCNRSLCVGLRAPAEKLHDIYDSHTFHYRLTVSSEDGAEFEVETEGLQSVPLNNVAPGRTYCVTVSIIERITPRRPPVCASIPKAANLSDAVISVVLFLLMLLFLRFARRLVSRCFCSKPPLPPVLSTIENGKKVILITAVEPFNTLYEVRDSSQKTRRNGEETDVEGETEEAVSPERRVPQYLDAQGSSLIVFPGSSCSELLTSRSTDADPSLASSADDHSLIVFEDGCDRTTEPAASAQETSPLHSLSLILPTHVEDRESGTDVNLFSVKLRGVWAEPHKAEPDQMVSISDELGSDSQCLLQTDSRPQSRVSEEDEECSDYLSRN